jgi:hypothetical protein
MCEQCQNLQKKIQHYRWFTAQGFDPLTIERIKAMIQELEQRLQVLH